MLDTVQQFFQRVLAAPESSERDAVTPQLAVAVLLSEVLRADYEVDPQELAMLREVLSAQFSLNDAEVDGLIREARQRVDQAVDHFQYVSLLNERYRYDQRVELIAAIKAINESIVPPTINLDNQDERCDLKMDYVPLKARETQVDIAISNSFGFGGHNACLVVGKV